MGLQLCLIHKQTYKLNFVPREKGCQDKIVATISLYISFNYFYEIYVCTGCFKQKIPTLFYFSFRDTFGMNVLVLTIHMTGILQLSIIQAFTAL